MLSKAEFKCGVVTNTGGLQTDSPNTDSHTNVLHMPINTSVFEKRFLHTLSFFWNCEKNRKKKSVAAIRYFVKYVLMRWVAGRIFDLFCISALQQKQLIGLDCMFQQQKAWKEMSRGCAGLYARFPSVINLIFLFCPPLSAVCFSKLSIWLSQVFWKSQIPLFWSTMKIHHHKTYKEMLQKTTNNTLH